MSVNGAHIAAGQALISRPASAARSRGRLARALRRASGRALSVAFVVGIALFGAGLVHFADALPHGATTPGVADAVVVLTGGENRVARAVELIADGKGQRLLISGVNDHTSAAAIAEAVAQNQALFNCCIDIDRRARNTIGNAVEIARWVKAHGYRSLIVVTGAYHMPRALNELRRALPDTELIADPVLTPGLDLKDWWTDERTVRVITFEYAKYLASEVRTRLPFANPEP
jgi:uncharacterized SAM-binding protein YcdF (DUF218 family)